MARLVYFSVKRYGRLKTINMLREVWLALVRFGISE